MMDLFKHPIFIFASLMFWINQYLEKSLGLFVPFYHAYGDDLMAMPVVFGICLQLMRWVHPAKEELIFSKTNILVGLAYFSIVFEIILPRISEVYTADPLDVLCYALGAWVFMKFMNKPAPQPKILSEN